MFDVSIVLKLEDFQLLFSQIGYEIETDAIGLIQAEFGVAVFQYGGRRKDFEYERRRMGGEGSLNGFTHTIITSGRTTVSGLTIQSDA